MQKGDTAPEILLVDDDADFRWAVRGVLLSAGYRVRESNSGAEALNIVKERKPDLILLDFRMPGMDGLEFLARLEGQLALLPVIIVTAYAEVETAVRAIQLGAYDYITKPAHNSEVLLTVQRALERVALSKEVRTLKELLDGRIELLDLMGRSDSIQALLRYVEKVAPTPLNVLIEGESGSGKELVARAIHNRSECREGPFIAVDCGAIPETLMESELFGFARGAFTGAYAEKPGFFEMANGGTIFLDEVANIPFSAQQKLLRTIEERSLFKLGGKKSSRLDVRIISATNRPMEKELAESRFRPDLFYRLTEFTIRVMPLRERKEDIPYLVQRFIRMAEDELKKKSRGITREALSLLIGYAWPGNVRELKNVVRQAILLSDDGKLITPANLAMLGSGFSSTGASVYPTRETQAELSLKELRRQRIQDVESALLKEALVRADGNKREAARLLEIDYKTLFRRMKRYKLN